MTDKKKALELPLVAVWFPASECASLSLLSIHANLLFTQSV
jgi:hypothetical protein